MYVICFFLQRKNIFWILFRLAAWFELERNQEGSMVRYNVQEITFVNCNSATDKQRYIFLTFVATWLAR